MDWKDKSRMVQLTAHLGKRESQVLVLKNLGYEVHEMKEIIQELEGSAPTEATLHSIQSKLKRRHIQSHFTKNAIGDGADSILLPSAIENEFNQDVTTTSYTGKIGCGKTLTAEKHAYELEQNNDVDFIVAISPLKEWDRLPDSSTINKVYIDSSNSSDVVSNIENEINSFVKSLSGNQSAVLFLDQAHYILTNDNVCRRISDTFHSSPANISFRPITQLFNEVEESAFNVDVYNIFRDESEMANKKFDDISVHPRNLHVGTEQNPWNEVIHSKNNETKLQCVYLSEEEKNSINL